jgi:hypothetical protein
VGFDLFEWLFQGIVIVLRQDKDEERSEPLLALGVAWQDF